VEEVDLGDILPRPHFNSICCVPSEATGVQRKRDPACESRGPFGGFEIIQGTHNMS
jgi:hypothetical protein